jgi:hypothetical protein
MRVRTIVYGLAFLVVAAVAATAEVTRLTPADRPIGVVINGQSRQYDTPPLIVKDRVLVPMRGVFEDLGALVMWNESQQLATAQMRGNRTISLAVGSGSAVVNGQPVALEVPAQLHRHRVYVPLRFVCAATGYQVAWEGAHRRVAIATPTGMTIARATVCPGVVPAEVARVEEPASVPQAEPMAPLLEEAVPSQPLIPLTCPPPCPTPYPAPCPVAAQPAPPCGCG